ncbi:MAG TPA: hypothetical protein VJS15_04595 [Allosphingosinicella sp.]|nr:hypothetical protein [Allosphingosinicella sp.]
MICNIIDARTRPYRWRAIDAIIEATSHDNGCEDSDQQPPADDDPTYARREGISLSEAVSWAHAQPGAVTLYLYDEGASGSDAGLAPE